LANQPACIQPTTQPASQPAKKLLVNQTIISPYKKDRLIDQQKNYWSIKRLFLLIKKSV